MRYLDQDNGQGAVYWFKRAADKGFEPSVNNLKNTNYLYTLLPNEIIEQIAKNLEMPNLLRFSRTSKRAHDISAFIWTSTDYLHSNLPCAWAVQTLFKDVIFEPLPDSIRLINLVKAHDRSIEVHFRNAQHLKDIVGIYPLINAKKTYYVFNQNVKDGKEIISSNNKLLKNYFFHIIAPTPLMLKSKLNAFDATIFLPPKSDFNQMAMFLERCHLATCKLNNYHNGRYIAHFLDTFNSKQITQLTDQALNLMDCRRKERTNNLQLFPEILKLCPKLKIIFDEEVHTEQHDYLESAGPIVYMAHSYKELNQLKEHLPEFNKAINFIYLRIIGAAIYSDSALTIRSSFKIISSGSVAILGSMEIRNYNIEFNIKEHLWCLGSVIYGHSIYFKEGRNFYNQAGYGFLTTKPEYMSWELWAKVLQCYGINLEVENLQQ